MGPWPKTVFCRRRWRLHAWHRWTLSD